MDRVMEICILVCLLCNLISHYYLGKRIDILQEWIEVLHGIDFDKMTKAVRKWQAEQTEPSDDWICNTCKYHNIERAVQCKMCGDGGQYEPKQTENCSEFPNNCETCKHYKLTCDLFSEVCKYEPKTEPQTEDEILREQCRAFIGIVEQTERSNDAE